MDDIHKSHPQDALLFPFIGITLGALTDYYMTHYCPWIPYTCFLIIEGVGIGILNEYVNVSEPLSASIHMWETMDPHLLLYVFLPALLFGDSMGLNVHLEQKCFFSAFMLACPGVLIGTTLTAAFAFFAFPYGWDWNLSMSFGAILAATDPVAVVSLLKALGASPKLTMLITGESLLNDGTSIVVFQLFFAIFLHDNNIPGGKAYDSFGKIALFTIQMIGGGIALGLVFGYVYLECMVLTKNKLKHTDAILQLAFSLCCAYLCFYCAERIFHVSGVLAVVTAAHVLAKYVWPWVCSKETMRVTWHTIEFLGNTLIFLIAGTVIGKTMSSRFDHGLIAWSDFGWAIFLYVISMVIRGLMILILSPALMQGGVYGASVKEMIFMTWGGLRGAVGLALALAVDLTLTNHNHGQATRDGSLFMVHVGGMAVFTLLINGTLAGPLLHYLKMTAKPEAKNVILHTIKERMQSELMAKFNMLKNDPVYCELDDATVRRYVRMLHDSDEESKGPLTKEEESDPGPPDAEKADPDLLPEVRVVFLHVVRAEYDESIEQGLLPAESEATLALLDSVECALDDPTMPLHDWDTYLQPAIGGQPWAVPFLRCLDKWLPSSFHWDDKLILALDVSKREKAVYVCQSYIQAHEKAAKEIAKYVGKTEAIDSHEELAVINESRRQVAKARKLLAALPKSLVRAVHSRQVGTILASTHQHILSQLTRKGLLAPSEAEEFMEEIEHTWEHMRTHRREIAKQIANDCIGILHLQSKRHQGAGAVHPFQGTGALHPVHPAPMEVDDALGLRADGKTPPDRKVVSVVRNESLLRSAE